jgi:hypothetical protein
VGCGFEGATHPVWLRDRVKSSQDFTSASHPSLGGDFLKQQTILIVVTRSAELAAQFSMRFEMHEQRLLPVEAGPK